MMKFKIHETLERTAFEKAFGKILIESLSFRILFKKNEGLYCFNKKRKSWKPIVEDAKKGFCMISESEIGETYTIISNELQKQLKEELAEYYLLDVLETRNEIHWD